MPKSKRAKVVHLSKTTKKGKELSERLFSNVRECADNFTFCFVFEVDNMRNTYLKEVRSEFADSRYRSLAIIKSHALKAGRLFFGKTKVMAKALGTTPEEEHLPGLSDLSKHLVGNVGLFFTNQEPEGVIAYFNDYVQTDFARAGITASRDFVVPEGVIYSRGGEVVRTEDVPLEHPLEPMLRKFGMPTRLVRGKIMLDQPYTVCTEGQELNSHQTALLKTFGVAIAEFKVQLKAYYNSATQQVVTVEATEG